MGNKTEVLDIKVEFNKNNKKKFIFRYIPMILIPLLSAFTVVSFHSNELIIVPINYIIYVLLLLSIIFLITGFFVITPKYKNKKTKKKKNNKKKTKKKKKRTTKELIAYLFYRTYDTDIINVKEIIFYIFYVLYVLCGIAVIILLYGPNDKFRNWYISTGMATMDHQYLCKWFYSDEEIQKILDSNYIIEVDENTDTDLIDVEVPKHEEITYENEYERQVLEREEDQKYKLIELKVNDQDAYLAIIYDPSMVKVGVTSALGRYGQYATRMAEENNALLATNGGGFFDPGNCSTGGMPTGITIAGGRVITDNNYSSYTQNGGVIGMTYDHKLVLAKVSSAKEALDMGIRDAVSWGPFLITNGKKAFIQGNGGWGYAARTAIGQRSDGIILLLVVDSNATRTKGANMVDLTEIMSNYGAINAANLDGGTSSVMVLPKQEALNYIDTCDKAYCYINDPIDSTLSHKTRGIATTIIVSE